MHFKIQLIADNGNVMCEFVLNPSAYLVQYFTSPYPMDGELKLTGFRFEPMAVMLPDTFHKEIPGDRA